MTVILPICKNPPFSELHTTAFPLSVLTTATRFTNEWLLQNFVQIVYTKKFGHVLTYDRPYFWFWDCFTFHICLHGPCSNVARSVIHWLEKGYYVFLCINEKYMPQRFDYQKKDFDHELLIYGYQDNPLKFHTIAYNNEQKYTPQLVSAKDLKRAFFHCKYHYFKFYPFRVKPKYPFAVDISAIKKQISRYLHPCGKHKGRLAYSALLQSIEDIAPNQILDIRNFKTMMEHARLLSAFCDMGFTNEQQQELIHSNIQLGQLMFYLALKYNKTRDVGLIGRIIQYIGLFRDKEAQIFEGLCQRMDC